MTKVKKVLTGDKHFEKLLDQPLTEMQKKFANLYVEAMYGNKHLSNTECAVKAGYSSDSAYQRAHELLNPKFCPHVVKYIGSLKEDFRIKNNIDPDKHMARLNRLGQLAEEKGQFGVAGRMEELRGKVAGYYVERILNKESKDNLSVEELEEQLQKLLTDWNVSSDEPMTTATGGADGKNKKIKS